MATVDSEAAAANRSTKNSEQGKEDPLLLFSLFFGWLVKKGRL